MAEKPPKDEESIFYKALEKRPEDRAACLKEACGDDRKLYSRVEALLRSSAVDDGFLENPMLDSEATLDTSGPAEAPGTVIGRYKLLERIGEGGMAVVYMAEQAEMSGLDVDTRTDIYSLGVLLYELLTGTTPFDGERLRSVGYLELQRIIREEDPTKPSTKLSNLSDRLADIARHRHPPRMCWPGLFAAIWI